MYQSRLLTCEYFKIFSGVYEDFRINASFDYKFEIPPLEYKDFIEYFEKGLLKCIILLEDDIPTGFLAYSTKPDEAIELYVIHCLGNEDIQKKARALLTYFIQTITPERFQKIVCYPMLGKQEALREEVESFGFEFVELGVLVFNMKDRQKLKDFSAKKPSILPIGYKITPYKDIYYQELVNSVYGAFKNSSDVNFDPRFASLNGVHDIVSKITTSVYGQFLPVASKMLLHENRLVGFVLSNITDGKIGNLPLVGIIPEHQGQGLSEILLKTAMDELVKLSKTGIVALDEVNVSLDMYNRPAYKMYKAIDFEDSYTYPQAYLKKLQNDEY